MTRKKVINIILPIFALAIFVLGVSVGRAGSVTIPHTFTVGTTARASEVNANFSVLKEAIEALEARVETLEANSVLALDGKLSLDTSGDYPTALFSGVNVQVVNGTDNQTELNGLGNLIVGYNEAHPETEYDYKTGSHNLVAGNKNSYSNYGGVVFGEQNLASGAFATVTGGWNGVAGGHWSNVSSGAGNNSSGDYSSVSGGSHNNANGESSTVSGGWENTASGNSSSVSGGQNNTASGDASSVSGGSGHQLDSTNQWSAGTLPD